MVHNGGSRALLKGTHQGHTESGADSSKDRALDSSQNSLKMKASL